MNLKSYLTSQTKINPTSITELNLIEAKITQKNFGQEIGKKYQKTFLILVETKVFRKSTIKKEEMNKLNFIEMKKIVLFQNTIKELKKEARDQ